MTTRTQCISRNIKRIKEQSDTNASTTRTYTFYRQIIYPSILRLNNEKDKVNCSLWLTRLDNEKTDLKIHLIKILFLSLNKTRPFYIFSNPPPEDMSELNLNYNNTMEMIESLQNSTDFMSANEDVKENVKFKRAAAVATDMCSYSSIKTSQNVVQSFYARSDFPLYMWNNPLSIRVPSSIDHNEWELYLNNLDIAIESKEKHKDDKKHKNECEHIMSVNQESMVFNTSSKFAWHPQSKLYGINRPKITASFIEADLDLTIQPINQEQIDESALGIVHKKILPGYKTLNPRIYTTILMPDSSYVFKMTGVTIIYNNLSRITPNKPLPCPEIALKETRSSQTLPIITDTTAQKQIDTPYEPHNDSECSNLEFTHTACDELLCDSNKSSESAHKKILRKSCKSNKPTKKPPHNSSSNKCRNCLNKKQTDTDNTNPSKPQNEYTENYNPCKSLFIESTNYDRSMLNDDIKLDQTLGSTCTVKNTSNPPHKRHHIKGCLDEERVSSSVQRSQCNNMSHIQISVETKQCEAHSCRHHDNKHGKQRSNTNEKNLSHSVGLHNQKCANENTNSCFSKNKTIEHLKSKLISDLEPVITKCIHQTLKHKYKENENDEALTYSEYEPTHSSDVSKENVEEYSLAEVNNNKEMSKYEYDESWKPKFSDSPLTGIYRFCDDEESLLTSVRISYLEPRTSSDDMLVSSHNTLSNRSSSSSNEIGCKRISSNCSIDSDSLDPALFKYMCDHNQ